MNHWYQINIRFLYLLTYLSHLYSISEECFEQTAPRFDHSLTSLTHYLEKNVNFMCSCNILHTIHKTESIILTKYSQFRTFEQFVHSVCRRGQTVNSNNWFIFQEQLIPVRNSFIWMFNVWMCFNYSFIESIEFFKSPKIFGIFKYPCRYITYIQTYSIFVSLTSEGKNTGGDKYANYISWRSKNQITLEKFPSSYTFLSEVITLLPKKDVIFWCEHYLKNAKWNFRKSTG